MLSLATQKSGPRQLYYGWRKVYTLRHFSLRDLNVSELMHCAHAVAQLQLQPTGFVCMNPDDPCRYPRAADR